MTQNYFALRIARLCPTKTSLRQFFRTDPKSTAVPDQDFQTIAPGIAEQEQVPAQGLARQSIPHLRLSLRFSSPPLSK